LGGGVLISGEMMLEVGFGCFVRVARSYCYMIFVFAPLSFPPSVPLLASYLPPLHLSSLAHMSPNPYSSSSSLESLFDITASRSVTPLSPDSSCDSPHDITTSCLPKIFVHIPAVEPDVLTAIIRKYGQGGRLGLYLPTGMDQSLPTFLPWDKQNIYVEEKFQTFHVFVSTSSEDHTFYDFDLKFSAVSSRSQPAVAVLAHLCRPSSLRTPSLPSIF
jgi:hypothetical protein